MELQQELRTAIHTALMKISVDSHPHIWARTQSKQGYALLEDQIIAIMVAQTVTVSTAISLIESDEV